MDETELYIKMAEKATKIQESRKKHQIGMTTISGEGEKFTPVSREQRTHYRIGEEGDFILEKGVKQGKYEENSRIFCIDGDRKAHYYADTGVWLPRQDQLQEMLPDEVHSDGLKTRRTGYFYSQQLYNWYDNYNYPNTDFFIDATMEQIWLAFVMFQKYNKVWNGEDWVSA